MPRRSGLEIWTGASLGHRSCGTDQITEKRAPVSPQGMPKSQMDIGRVASSLESERQEGESSRAVSVIL